MYILWTYRQYNTLFLTVKKKSILEDKGPMLEKVKGFDITIENFILECIIFGFPGRSQNIKWINYCILYAKYVIYKNKMNEIENIGFLGYPSYLKQILTNYGRKYFPCKAWRKII